MAVIIGFLIFLLGFAAAILLMYKNLTIVGLLISAVGMLIIQREIIKKEGVISFWKSKHTIGFISCLAGFAIINLSHVYCCEARKQFSVIGVMLFIAGFLLMISYTHGKGFLNDNKKYKESLKSKQPWDK